MQNIECIESSDQISQKSRQHTLSTTFWVVKNISLKTLYYVIQEFN